MSSSPKVSASSTTKMFRQVTGFLAKGVGFVVDGLIGTAITALEGVFRSVFDIITFPFVLIEGIFKILTTNPVTTVKNFMGRTPDHRKRTIVNVVKKISMVAFISLLTPSVVIGLNADIPILGFNFMIGNSSKVASIAAEHCRNSQIIYDFVV